MNDVKVTKAMLRAGGETLFACSDGDHVSDECLKDVYVAMVKASRKLDVPAPMEWTVCAGCLETQCHCEFYRNAAARRRELAVQS